MVLSPGPTDLRPPEPPTLVAPFQPLFERITSVLNDLHTFFRGLPAWHMLTPTHTLHVKHLFHVARHCVDEAEGLFLASTHPTLFSLQPPTQWLDAWPMGGVTTTPSSRLHRALNDVTPDESPVGTPGLLSRSPAMVALDDEPVRERVGRPSGLPLALPFCPVTLVCVAWLLFLSYIVPWWKSVRSILYFFFEKNTFDMCNINHN